MPSPDWKLVRDELDTALRHIDAALDPIIEHRPHMALQLVEHREGIERYRTLAAERVQVGE